MLQCLLLLTKEISPGFYLHFTALSSQTAGLEHGQPCLMPASSPPCLASSSLPTQSSSTDHPLPLISQSMQQEGHWGQLV